MITESWLEVEIGKLELELAGAKSRLDAAAYRLGKAEADYKDAKGTVETTEGLIRALRDELEFTRGRDDRP